MMPATAHTPHGTFTKKRTAHRYVAVIVWHYPERVHPGGWFPSGVEGAPDYFIPESRTEACTFVTWHREGSKLPKSHRGAQRLGVYPVELT